MMELQDFETHLNLVKDFTGSRARMSSTTSSGTGSRIVVVVWGFTLLSGKRWNAGRTRRNILYMWWPFGLPLFLRLRFQNCVCFFCVFFILFRTVNSIFVYCLRFHKLHFLTISFIKNGSHITIYTFKNYFATVFSISVFSFSKNKLCPRVYIFYLFNFFQP